MMFLTEPSDSSPAHSPATAIVRGSGVSRMDMHVHSRASSEPVVPALGFIGMPECYSPPERVYEQARARGMTFVTLTDHDTIGGAMELVERGFEGVLVGEEVTVQFPEDRCKLHVLVWGLSGAQHEAIGALGLREDVYSFAAWLREQELAHALAHPLYVQNNRFERAHLEKCALLFRAFETLNGAHAGSHRTVLERWMSLQTPATINELSKKHGIEPVWPRAWLKPVTAGSDDHALLNVGRTYTEVRAGGVGTAEDFLRSVMAGKGSVQGQAGHSSLLAHQLSTVMLGYAADRVSESGASAKTKHIVSKLARFAGVEAVSPRKASLVFDALRRKAPARRARELALTRALKEALGPALDKHPHVRSRLRRDTWLDAGPPMADHEGMATFAEDLSAGITRFLMSDAARSLRKRDRAGVMDAVVSYALATLAQAPYVFSLFHQNKERPLLERLEREMDGASGAEGRPMRVSLFTDTLGDVNGVCRFIQNVAEQARATGRDLHVVTSTRMPVPESSNIFNFEPALAFKMPRYENLEVTAPPLLKVLRHIDRHQPDAIHISTPGPVGLVGFVAAKMLRVPVLGVYHTDFPAYVDRLFEDEGLTKLCERFMRFFYGPFHTIFTRSEDYVKALEGLGLERSRTRTLPAGVDVGMFHPRHRDPGVWRRISQASGGAVSVSPTSVKALYVGRVSYEKNLPMLARVWRVARERIARQGREAELIIVGDGPYREAMAQAFSHVSGKGGVRFLGFRHGLELSQIYASSDFFLFPSTTDTLGQVVLESQASGLPVVVTEQGGPKEVVDEGLTGFVVKAADEGAWVDAVERLVVDDELRGRLGRTAHVRAQRRSLEASFEHFWSAHEDAWRKHIEESEGGGASEPRAQARGVGPAGGVKAAN